MVESEAEVIEDQMSELIPLNENGQVVISNRPFETDTVFDIEPDVEVGSGDFDSNTDYW
jgi:hypothetical protein